MRKRILAIAFAVIICLVVAVQSQPVKAASYKRRIVDAAFVFTVPSFNNLNTELGRASKAHDVDITAATVDGTDGISLEETAAQIFEESDFGMGKNKDGILLLMDVHTKDIRLFTSGKCDDIFLQDYKTAIISELKPLLEKGRYDNVVSSFVDMCDEYLSGTVSERVLRLTDKADILTDAEEEKLIQKLDEISERQQFDIIVVTVQSLGGEDAEAYTESFFRDNGFGMGQHKNGCALLMSMEHRDWSVFTEDTGRQVFTSAGLDYVVETLKPLLSEEKYYEAFETFAKTADDFITQGDTGKPYDSDSLPKEMSDYVKWILISLVIGVVVSFGILAYLKSQLKSVRSEMGAARYEKDGSFVLTQRDDRFLYRHVSRTEIPRSNGSSSSGRGSGSYSGGSRSRSGKF